MFFLVSGVVQTNRYGIAGCVQYMLAVFCCKRREPLRAVEKQFLSPLEQFSVSCSPKREQCDKHISDGSCRGPSGVAFANVVNKAGVWAGNNSAAHRDQQILVRALYHGVHRPQANSFVDEVCILATLQSIRIVDNMRDSSSFTQLRNFYNTMPVCCCMLQARRQLSEGNKRRDEW